MCGIAGILDFSREEVDQAKLERFATSLIHRGPDDGGVYTGPHIGLASRRLAVLDLTAHGHMPMSDAENRYHLVYNGELYNFRELRTELMNTGHHFTSNSDTEVILHAYMEWGDSCPQHLTGMFAFALWDCESEELFLCRDRLGVKPLFFTEKDSAFSFASELHPLLEAPMKAEDIAPEALDYYLAYGYIPSDRTIHQAVHKLAPGHALRITRQGSRSWRYWTVSFRPSNKMTESRALQETETLLRRAVKRRLVSDVPLGCFLSGGIDSALVVALASQESGDGLHTYSVGFTGANPQDDERGLARLVADRYRTNHTELEVGAEGKAILPRLLYHFAEPFVDVSALPVYQISKAAREHITVALTGDGGDESFAGYANIRAAWIGESVRRFIPGPLRRIAALMPGALRWKRFAKQYVDQGVPAQYNLLNHWETALRPSLYRQPPFLASGQLPAQAILAEVQARAKGLSDPELHLFTDLHLRLPGDYLTKVDIASNLVSLEIRSPFLDQDVVEFAASLPLNLRLKWGRQKYLLRRLAEKFLPDELIHAPKRGFGPKLGDWIRSDWADPVETLVCGSLANRKELFHGSVIRKVVQEHQSGERDHTTRIWALLCFEIWWQLFIDQTMQPGDSL